MGELIFHDSEMSSPLLNINKEVLESGGHLNNHKGCPPQDKVNTEAPETHLSSRNIIIYVINI